MTPMQPITLLICALGGEGGGVLTEWLIDTARRAGHPAQSTSIPGVAQRTGATTYYLEVSPRPLSELGGRSPVFSLNPLPGRLDALLSSELLETSRQIANGLVSAERTCVISSSARTLTTLERMPLGDGRQDSAELLALLRQHSRAHHVLDMAGLAREAGTLVSAVMLGALAASGLLPFAREHYEATLRAGGIGVEASLRGFARAWDALQAQARQQQAITEMLPNQEQENADGRWLAPEMAEKAAHNPALAAFPPPVHELLALGHARVCSYQHAAYGALYLERLQRVRAAERASDPHGAHSFAATREMARWLALWMAFDDIVHVAELKSRASRLARVRREVRPGEHDLLKVYEHFKPGAAEFAALLPEGLAQRLLAWDRARQQRGLAPWALPIQVGTHTVGGMLALRTLARLKGLRARGSRYALEQRLIEQWLAGVERGLRENWDLGHELALCGRLIKGYGSTNERGKDNLLHLLQHLAFHAPVGDAAARAQAVAQARRAALQDEAGRALDTTLTAHGAPPRPLREQPIRWMKRPTATAAPAKP